jgi:hypothetical protein
VSTGWITQCVIDCWFYLQAPWYMPSETQIYSVEWSILWCKPSAWLWGRLLESSDQFGGVVLLVVGSILGV